MSRIFYSTAKASRSINISGPASAARKLLPSVLSEPASGADPSMMQTTATPDGDYFKINGSKMFPTFADVADFVQLFARLPGTKGREGVTCFLIDTGTPGYRVVRSIATIAGTEPCELVFEDCRVHKSQVLGEVGNGWALNQAWLGARRFQVGIRAHGMAQRVLNAVAQVLRQDAKEGEKYAGIIGHFLGELEALKALTYSASWRADQKMDVSVDAAKVKLFGTELAHKVIDFALEAVGPSAHAQRACDRPRVPPRAGAAHHRGAVGNSAPYHSAGAVSPGNVTVGIAVEVELIQRRKDRVRYQPTKDQRRTRIGFSGGLMSS